MSTGAVEYEMKGDPLDDPHAMSAANAGYQEPPRFTTTTLRMPLPVPSVAEMIGLEGEGA
jgi:hypothetical protein